MIAYLKETCDQSSPRSVGIHPAERNVAETEMPLEAETCQKDERPGRRGREREREKVHFDQPHVSRLARRELDALPRMVYRALGDPSLFPQ